MKEERIENFLSAGKLLQVKGVSVGDNIQIADSEESCSPENSADQVLNSTASSEHSQQVENLREANHLRSFVHDISNIQHRPLLQEVSVNIRRMSKEDTMLHSTRSLDILDTSRRSSRINGSNINYCEDELPEHSTRFSKSCSIDNISPLQSPPRRTLLGTNGSEEVDMEELFLLENNGDSFGNCRTLGSLSSTPQIPAARRRSAPAPGGRRECDQCQESIATAEMDNHVRTMHRRSRRSLPEPSQRRRSIPNLGSLYRTKPLESRRSVLAKTSTENIRKKPYNKKSPERPASRSVGKTDRLRMLKSLGGAAESLPQTADPVISENVIGTEQTNIETILSSTNHGTDETANHSQTNHVSQYPSTPSTQESASNIEVSPVTGQQPETESGPETSTHGDKNETKIGAVDMQALTPSGIDRHIVSLGGRSMCKICGIQVRVM